MQPRAAPSASLASVSLIGFIGLSFISLSGLSGISSLIGQISLINLSASRRYGASLGGQKTRKRDILRVFSMSDL
jgi:hypothetical protein